MKFRNILTTNHGWPFFSIVSCHVMCKARHRCDGGCLPSTRWWLLGCTRCYPLRLQGWPIDSISELTDWATSKQPKVVLWVGGSWWVRWKCGRHLKPQRVFGVPWLVTRYAASVLSPPSFLASFGGRCQWFKSRARDSNPSMDEPIHSACNHPPGNSMNPDNLVAVYQVHQASTVWGRVQLPTPHSNFWGNGRSIGQ